jgi:hypothetical protein
MADEPNAALLEELRRLLGRPDPVGFTRHGIAPGAFSYITRDDKLYIRARNSVTAAAVTISGRIHQPDGHIHEFVFVHTPNTDRSVSLEAFDLGEGYLVGLAVHASAGTVRRGQCWVELGLLRGLTAADSVRQVLGRDYVSTDDAWGWPGAPNKSSLHGPGAIRSITGTDPAAGVEISETVPTNARWKPLAVRFELVTDANAANRSMQLSFTDGSAVYQRTIDNAAQTLSQTRRYNFALGAHFLSAGAASGEFVNVLPEITMLGGHIFASVSTNLQAADNYGAPQFLVEEWLEE